ncbi:MAG TPA: hypothetical protein PKD49_02900 [Hyphomicrobium sp.]|nr:hypothetical protein [Hyphomicrobium sp.]
MNNLLASLNALADAQDLCGTDELDDHFEIIRASIYEFIGRAQFDALMNQ